MTDAERLGFERRGRELVLRYGKPEEIVAMRARMVTPVEVLPEDPDQAEAYRMKKLGLTFAEIARRLGYHRESVRKWFA
jgi:hypothetical protein